METPKGRINKKSNAAHLRAEKLRLDKQESIRRYQDKRYAISTNNSRANNASNGQHTLVCDHCGSVHSVDTAGDATICIKCGVKIAENVGKYIIETEGKIVEKYNISPIQEMPLLICNCDAKEVIPFDFFTLPINDHEHFLILSTLCRSCGGYKEVPLSEIRFPINIKDPPPSCGLTITPKIKKTYTNEMFI